MAAACCNGDCYRSIAEAQSWLVEQAQLTIEGLKLAAFDRETPVIKCGAFSA